MFGLCDGGAPGFDGKEATDDADIGEAIHDEAEADGGGFGASCAEALDALEAEGWLLGVATGKSDRGLDLCLKHHGLRHRFVTLQTADRHPSKPHPSMVHEAMADAGATPATTVMIGDTSFDMAMGVAAGARSLGVDWGYHTTDDLLDAGAFHIASHPAHILEVLR